MNYAEDIGNYLGFPITTKRCGLNYRFIIEKIKGKLAGWKTGTLSMVGRTILIKSIINAIPTYYMQGTFPPKSTCEEINRIIRNFMWGSTEEKRKVHMIN